MLKRQRQPTPPPVLLGDPPFSLPDAPVRPLQPSLPADPSQPRFKRQRIRPPPLDGALRGWLQSESTGTHWESDGEEDWTEDASDPLPPPLTIAVDQYKDANSLLHELHVLNQHRLLFGSCPRSSYLNPEPKALLPTACTHTQDPPAAQRTAALAERSSYSSSSARLAHGGLVDRSSPSLPAARGLVEEVQCVRQRYEDANRYLGSLFLSRRREVERVTSPGDPGPSS